MGLSVGRHTHAFWCADSLKPIKCFDILRPSHSLFFLFPLSHTRSSLHPMSLNFLIAGRVKNQQWRLRLRRPAAAVIETVMRRGSVYTGREKDSSTHTHHRRGKMAEQMCGRGKDGFRRGAREGERGRKSEVDRRWLTAESTAAEASQEKHWSKQLLPSHSRDVEHHNWKVHLGAKLDVESATLTLPTFCLTFTMLSATLCAFVWHYNVLNLQNRSQNMSNTL